MHEVEPVAVPLSPTTRGLLVRLPEHLRLLCHGVLLSDGVAEHSAQIRTSGASHSLNLPVALKSVNWVALGDLVAWALAIHQVPIIPS